MQRVSKWLALSWSDRLLVGVAAALLWSARTMLYVIPFRWVWRVVGESSPGTRTDSSVEGSIGRVRMAIDRASNGVSRPSCLTRGVTAAVMLRLMKLGHKLVIGVDKGEGGDFRAHAWVISHGRIVTGDLPDLADFKSLPISPPERLLHVDRDAAGV